MSDTSKKTYFITGGGTGGHIYPAVAVLEELAKENCRLFYVGNPNNLEYRIVSNLGFDFLPVKISAMPRKIGFGFLKWLLQLKCASWKALYYIFKYRPSGIFGTGGYVSSPAIFAAIFSKTPYMIHDCDAQPGIVSKFAAPNAKAVSLAFEKSQQFIKTAGKIFVNGNPIRESFKTVSKEQARKDLGLTSGLVLTIMGGSQGAAGINKATVAILKKLVEELDLQVIFQTGAKNYNNISAILTEIYPDWREEKRLRVEPYFDDMVTVLKASDIAVSRAGSLSLSEICASKIAPILIPYPYAAADHQRKNARYMEELDACIYLEEVDATPEKLFEIIEELKNNRETLQKLQENTSKLAKPDAVFEIIKQFKSIAK